MKAVYNNPEERCIVRKRLVETVAYFTVHVVLIALSVLECKIAMTNNLAATIIATVVFIGLASFEHIYGPLVGYDHQGFTCATISCAFGQFVNWLWMTCWPQDFADLSTTIPLAILFSVFGFAIQCLMLWEDLGD